MILKRQQGFEVPYNWDDRLPPYFGEINERWATTYPITSVYMADKRSVTGSGRPGNALAERKRPYRDYADEFHAYRMKVKYVLNGTYHGGREFTAEMQDDVLRVVEELVKAEYDSVTVATPLLAMAIHQRFPQLPLSTSVNNHVDSRERVRQLFSYVPYQTIMLDNRHSRNFPLMRMLGEEFPQHELTVLANESCLPDCVLQPHHQDLLANMSRCGGLGDTSMDYCHGLCAKRKLQDPVQVLKAPWVRPDDVHHLFEAGVTTVKLAGRTMDSAWIARLASVYTTGRLDGYDVWPFVEKSGLTGSDWEHALGRKLPPCRYTVNNAALDGFIEPFVAGTSPCLRGHGGCGDCGHCASWAAKAVGLPPNREQRLHDIEELMDVVLQRSKDHRDRTDGGFREAA